MKTTIKTILTVVVLVASANSSARWHNPSQDSSSSHGHSMNMKDVDHSKMSACEHEMMNMDHSKMSASEHSKMSACDDSKIDMKDMGHHQESAHGH